MLRRRCFLCYRCFSVFCNPECWKEAESMREARIKKRKNLLNQEAPRYKFTNDRRPKMLLPSKSEKHQISSPSVFKIRNIRPEAGSTRG